MAAQKVRLKRGVPETPKKSIAKTLAKDRLLVSRTCDGLFAYSTLDPFACIP